MAEIHLQFHFEKFHTCGKIALPFNTWDKITHLPYHMGDNITHLPYHTGDEIAHLPYHTGDKIAHLPHLTGDKITHLPYKYNTDDKITPPLERTSLISRQRRACNCRAMPSMETSRARYFQSHYFHFMCRFCFGRKTSRKFISGGELPYHPCDTCGIHFDYFVKKHGQVVNET